MGKVFLNKESRAALYEGFKLLNDAVSSTLGPNGKTVVISNPSSGEFHPLITKDGVTVAKNIKSDDPVINAGIQIMRQPAIKMDEECGDGTTGVTAQTQALINASSLYSDFNVRKFRQDSLIVKNLFFEYLENQKIQISKEDIKDIAMVSSNGDNQISALLSELFNIVDVDSKINIIDSYNSDSIIKIEDGYVLDFGYLDPMFANTKDNTFVSSKCSVVILENELKEKEDFLAFLRDLSNDLIVIAKDFSYEITGIAKYFNDRNTHKICLVKNNKRIQENYGEYQDLAFLTNAEIAPKLSISYSPGMCYDITVKQGITVFKTKKDSGFQEYLKELKEVHKKSLGFAKTELEKRITKLEVGVITVLIGADTEIEQKEKMDRFKDSFNTIRNAIKYGVVKGGGYSYLRFIQGFKNKLNYVDIFVDMFTSIIKKLVENSDNNITLEEIYKSELEYNFMTNQFEDFEKTKILDPINVIKTQFDLSLSVATTLLSTECLIVN